MRRFVFAVSLMMVSAFCFASEELDMYMWLFNQAESNLERYSILRGASSSNLSDGEGLYAEALSRLLAEYPSLQTNRERIAAEASARLVCSQLGDLKSVNAANDLWKMYQVSANPLVKAEALMAVGRTRSPAHLEEVARALSDLNLTPAVDRDASEKIAYGAIIALEKYHNIAGYDPVFFAANSWYSGRVKKQAAVTLASLVDDPSDALIAIMNQNDTSVKLLAVQRASESRAPADRKSNVAMNGLVYSWTKATTNPGEARDLALLRKESTAVLIANVVPAEALPYLEKSFSEGSDLEDKVTAISAISKNKSDDAAAILSSFLLTLNKKEQMGGVTQEDEKLVRVVIPAIGRVGSPKGTPALKAVEFLDWPPAVKRLAADTLKQIK